MAPPPDGPARARVRRRSCWRSSAATVVDAGNADFAILGDRLLNITMFSALFVAFGLVASFAFVALERRVPPAASLSPRLWALTAVCALPVVPGVIGVAFSFGSSLGSR